MYVNRALIQYCSNYGVCVDLGLYLTYFVPNVFPLQLAKLPQLGESEKKQAGEDMELVITYYCKTRNIRFTVDCGWPELLVPFLSLGITRADLFNCFYAIMAKFIPRYFSTLY